MASCAFVLRDTVREKYAGAHHLRRLQLAADPQSAHHRLYPFIIIAMDNVVIITMNAILQNTAVRSAETF